MSNVSLPIVKKRGRKREFYEVERILNAKRIGKKVFFEVKWTGYSDEFNEWIEEKNMKCPKKIKNKYL